jgi:CRP-like cAMP-binding protein
MSTKRVSLVRKRSTAIRPPPTTPKAQNRILAALPPAEFRRLAPHLTTVPVRTKQILYKQGERVEHVYFPNGGVISITAVLPDGITVEAATVGDEGMLGVEAFLSDEAVAPGETLVQVPDTSMERLDVDAFRGELAEHGALYRLLGRYTQVFIAQMVQTTACNVLHPIQQRCARWLLMTHDRMHEQDFTLSHEFMAVMLGVQAAACQCYSTIRTHYNRLLV